MITRLNLYQNCIKSIDSDDHGYRKFLASAADIVGKNIHGALHAMESGTMPNGFWHPTGFAIFELLKHPEFGRLRIHVWPSRVRRTLPAHPPIHSHSFHLYSVIIAGEYNETQYDVEFTDDVTSAAGGRCKAYGVLPMHGDLDELYPIDGSVEPTIRYPPLTYPVGSWHDIAAGHYHSTPIPINSFCATLAMLSPRVCEFEDRLIGRRNVQPLSSRRRKVELSEVGLITEQFCGLQDRLNSQELILDSVRK